MKTLTTTYHGPTNTRGARISATDNDGNRVSIAYPHHAREPHAVAIKVLCDKMDWHGTLVQSGTKTGCVFVWVNSPTIDV